MYKMLRTVVLLSGLKWITPEKQIFQGMFDNITFTQCKFYVKTVTISFNNNIV